MFDSDSDSDSGSEFFGSNRLRRSSSSGSVSSESDTESQDADMGLLRQLQQQEQQRAAAQNSAAAAGRRPILIRMASATAPFQQMQAPVPMPVPAATPTRGGARSLLPAPVVPQPAQLVGYAVPAIERDPEGPPHVCYKCKLPIAIYGKLVCAHINRSIGPSAGVTDLGGGEQEPCSHVFCFACVDGCKTCPRCSKEVDDVRKSSNTDALFVCSAEGCDRGYFTQFSFHEHQKRRHHINPAYEQQRQRIAAAAGEHAGKA